MRGQFSHAIQHRNESSVADVLKSEGGQLRSQTTPILLATSPGKHEAHRVEPTVSINDNAHNVQAKRQVYRMKRVRHFTDAFTKALVA